MGGLAEAITPVGGGIAGVLVWRDSFRTDPGIAHSRRESGVRKGKIRRRGSFVPKGARTRSKINAQFNLGNTQYKQQRFDEAARSFNNSRETLTTPEEKAASWHNLGNSMYRSNKYAESVEAYRRALRLNPSDDDTRYNLLLARDKLKQQEEQKKNQKDKNDKQNKDQQNKDQQNKEQQNKDQQNKEQQNKDQQQDQQKNQQQQKNEQAKQDQTRQQQQKNQMPKEEAERILEAMKNNEKDLQKQLRKRQAVRVQVEKDW
jgi:Ca-activated chloride channel family protein